MKLLSVLILFFGFNVQASTLLMIGGGERPPAAMKTFVEAAGGAQARILVCSWASQNTEGAKAIQQELAAYRPQSLTLLPTFPMKSEDSLKLKSMIQTATAIFFSGGDQNKLMEAIQTEGLKPLLQDAYQKGIVFGGTSAGTAVMSERMITGDAATPDRSPPLAEGLGLLPREIIVDQHFLVRNRFSRLANLVMQNEKTDGVGIDEGTSLLLINNHIARVIGPSQVVLFSRSDARTLKVEYFQPNEMFNLFDLKD